MWRWLPVLAVLLVGCGGDDDDGNGTTDQVAVRNAGVTLWRSIDAALLSNTAAVDFDAGRAGNAMPSAASAAGVMSAGFMTVGATPTTLVPAHEYGLNCPDISVNVLLTELRIFTVYGDSGCTSDLTGEIHSGYAELNVSLGDRNGTLTANALTTGDYRVDGIIGASYQDTMVTIDARGVTVLSPDGNVMITSCLGITWSKGGTRLLLTDDSWRIEGTGVVSTLDFKSGAIYDVEVASGDDLVVRSGCRWPVAGSLTIERREPPLAASLDFGDGACDAMATVTVAGRSQTIDLEAR